jgi:hypothetical protein
MPNVNCLLQNHVALEVKCIDRMYLNGYIPQIQTEGGVINFFRTHRGNQIVSSVLMGQMSRKFVRDIDNFAKNIEIPIIKFKRGERKDDIAKGFIKKFKYEEGIMFIGKIQEKVTSFRTCKKRNEQTGQTYPWIYKGSTCPNQYYFYIIDRDFGPLFIKFSSYFPFTIRFCINGHEYVKRQLTVNGQELKVKKNYTLNSKLLTIDCEARRH